MKKFVGVLINQPNPPDPNSTGKLTSHNISTPISTGDVELTDKGKSNTKSDSKQSGSSGNSDMDDAKPVDDLDSGISLQNVNPKNKKH